MKKYVLLLALSHNLYGAAPAYFAKNFTTSRSFLFYRPVYYNINAQQSLWNGVIHEKQKENEAAVQLMGFFQRSNRTSKHIASYFLLHCKSCITIQGDTAPHNERRDIRAEYFNLPADYSGTFSLCPTQEQAAVLLEFNQNLSAYFDSPICESRWIGIQLPLMWIKNSLNPRQKVITSSPVSGQNNNFIQAFERPDITFSRIYFGSRKKIALAEIRLIAGSTLYNNDDFHVSTYSLLTFPTARKQHPVFLFDPYIGINGHIGIGAGMRLELPLHEQDACYKLMAFTSLEAIYFFQNNQCRTFDLKKPIDRGCFCQQEAPVACDPFYQASLPPQDIFDVQMTCKDNQWSRFLLYRRPGEAQTVRGVDILTFPVRIYPYGMFDFSGGFRLCYGNVEAEISYNIWGRNAEQAIFLPNCCEAEPLLFEQYGIAGAAIGTSASQSTIAQLAPADVRFVKIRKQDISLASGTYAGGMTHRFQASIGYSPSDGCLFGGIGGYYELPYKRYANFVIQNWGLWGKLGLEF